MKKLFWGGVLIIFCSILLQVGNAQDGINSGDYTVFKGIERRNEGMKRRLERKLQLAKAEGDRRKEILLDPSIPPEDKVKQVEEVKVEPVGAYLRQLTEQANTTGAVLESVRNNYREQEMLKMHKLAEQGDVTAQYLLAVMYGEGLGTIKDDKEAVRWYRKAAEQGQVLAQYNLGARYVRGKGVPRDYKKAVKWWEKAADQGYVAAQYTLGLVYAKGQGVTQNFFLAYMWFEIAAINGYKNAHHMRDMITKYLTDSQIKQAQKIAIEWAENHK